MGRIPNASFPLPQVCPPCLLSPDRQLSHTDDTGRARMVDVGSKPITDRRAVAEGRVHVGTELAAAIEANELKKGDLLQVARLGGIQAAKRASDLILLCHPLPLSHVEVEARLEGEYVLLRASVRTASQTGVEMEALAAVTGAALNVIDMGKAINPQIQIVSIQVIDKHGGKSGPSIRRLNPPPLVAILTVSDRRSQEVEEDLAGPALEETTRELLGAEEVLRSCVADETEAIQGALNTWLEAATSPDLILTTGGTGLAPRDVTPEATAALIERPHPGFVELARSRCLPGKPHAYLSRAVAGVCGRTLLVNLPGSPRGATETLRLMCDILPHALETLRGEDAPHPK